MADEFDTLLGEVTAARATLAEASSDMSVRAELLRKQAYRLRKLVGEQPDYCGELASVCREAARLTWDVAGGKYRLSYTADNLEPKERLELRAPLLRIGKDVARAYFGGNQPWLGARVWIARLQHWWQVRERELPFPDPGSIWWRRQDDPEVAVVMTECERGLDEERDYHEPLHWGVIPALSMWALAHSRKRKRWVTDEAAGQFAFEIVLGRVSANDSEMNVSGYRQIPEWIPTADDWRRRFADYRDHASRLQESDDGAQPGSVPLRNTIRPVSDNVERRALFAVGREEWQSLHQRTLARLASNYREDIQRWGIGDVEWLDDPLDGVLAPKATGLSPRDRQRKSRARRRYWTELGPAAGFTTTDELILALISVPEYASHWRSAEAAWGSAAWQAEIEERRAGRREAEQDNTREKPPSFEEWVVLPAWIGGIEVPRHNESGKEVTP